MRSDDTFQQRHGKCAGICARSFKCYCTLGSLCFVPATQNAGMGYSVLQVALPGLENRRSHGKVA